MLTCRFTLNRHCAPNQTPLTILLLANLWLANLAFGQSQPNPLRYKFNAGTELEYEFSGSADVDGTANEFSGLAKYKITAIDVSMNLSGRPLDKVRAGQSTSTAFAVTADGYMLTCAHCVLGAESITVKTAEGSLTAAIVDVNKKLDLAVIKVDTKHLPTIALGKDHNVELAQDVRAFGYPLSNVLGSSVKIARGAVSGFLNKQATEIYQIDVAVNPGNSGGPLVDDCGIAVGVVNAKLRGVAISKIGFSVPIAYACQILDKHKIKYRTQNQAKTLSGPDLAKRVTPAVFLVSARHGADGFQTHSNFQIACSGHIDNNDRVRHFLSQAIFDRDGIQLDSHLDKNIPFVFSNVCELPFEWLTPYVVDAWEDTHAISLQLPKKNSRTKHDLFLDHFHRHHMPGDLFDDFPELQPFDDRLLPDLRRGRSETLPGERTLCYQIKGRNQNKIRIERKETLRAIETDNDSPQFEFPNTRQLVFDSKRGLFTECQMEGNIKHVEEGKETNISVTFSFNLVGEKKSLPVIAGKPRNGQPNTANRAHSPVDTTPRKPAVKIRQPKQPDQLLIDFMNKKSLATNDQLLVLNRLKTERFELQEEQRRQLVPLVVSLADSKNRSIHKPAIEALMTLEAQSAVPFLARELEKANRFSRRSWISKLKQTEHQDAATSLCQALESDYSDTTIKQALKEMGQVAELPVLVLLRRQRNDAKACKSLLDILQTIGSTQTHKAIRAWIIDEHWRPNKDTRALVRRLLDVDDDPFDIN